MSTQWPWESKMWELLAQKGKLEYKFFLALLNPLSPNINIQILQTDLRTFP